MHRTLLVDGSPDLGQPREGRCGHGVVEVPSEGTALAVAECLVDDPHVARKAIDAALASLLAPRGMAGPERIRLALLAADAAVRSTFGESARRPPRCALALALVIDNLAFVGSAGPIRIQLMRDRTILHRVDETEIPLGGRPEENPSFGVPEAPWVLQQSDRLILWASPVYEVIEDVLLPNLMANRPPDRCVESMLKLARYRGLDEDHAVIVAAWQDPALATVAEEFAVHFDDDTAGALASRDAFPAGLMVGGTPAPVRRDGVGGLPGPRGTRWSPLGVALAVAVIGTVIVLLGALLVAGCAPGPGRG